MKGFTKDKKFHPIKPYKGIRKSRVSKETIQGIKIIRKARTEIDKGWHGLALSTSQLEKMYINCKSNFAENGQASRNAILNVYTGSATSHVHGRTSCEEYGRYCYYCGLNLDAVDQKNLRKAKVEVGENLSRIQKTLIADKLANLEIIVRDTDRSQREKMNMGVRVSPEERELLKELRSSRNIITQLVATLPESDAKPIFDKVNKEVKEAFS